jgi:Asp/Glu/hydantoin racemase
MSKRLVLIHTVPSLIEMFTGLSKEILPADVEVVHIADEVLLWDLLGHGGITPFVNHHFTHHVIEAEQSGADVVLLTCSSIAPCVEVAQPMVSIPVLRIDEAMVDKAISIGTDVGVIATAPTALEPLTAFVSARAGLANRKVKVDPVLCDREAYDAMLAGDVETHDRIVRSVLRELMSRNEVVLLAQGSMVSAAESIPPEERAVPILSSPRLALEHVHDLLRETTA